MEYLFAVIGLLVAGITFLWVKKGNAEALLNNTKTKEELNNIDSGIAKNEGLLSAEETKRKQLEANIGESKGKNESLDDLSDFFNKH